MLVNEANNLLKFLKAEVIMKAILLKVVVSMFVIAFIASCDDPVKPTETPTPNPALLKYKSLIITSDGMQRTFTDSVYSWDNTLKKGDSRIDVFKNFSFGFEISSKSYETPEGVTRGKFHVEGNSLIYSFDTLSVHPESKQFISRYIKLTFDSSLSTITNCTITYADSVNGIGTTIDGRVSVQRLHYKVNTGTISNIPKESEDTFSLTGTILESAISGFNAPGKITNEYPDGSYSERFSRFGKVIVSDKSKIKIELGQ